MRTLNSTLQTALDSGSYTPYFSVRIHDLLTDYEYAVLTPIEYKLTDLEFTFKALVPAFLDVPLFRTYLIFSRGVTITGVNYVEETSQFTIIDNQWDGNFQTFNCHLFPKSYYTAPGDVPYSEVITSFCEAFNMTAAFLDPDADWLDWQFYPEGKVITLNNAQQFFNLLKQKYFIFATDNGNNEILFYTAFTYVPTNQYTVPGYHYLVDYNVDAKRQYLWRDENETIHQTAPTFKSLGALETDGEYILAFQNIGGGTVLAAGKKGSVCKIFRSVDFGVTWDAGYAVSALNGSITAVNSFVSPALGVVLATVQGAGVILRSTNYGVSWSVITLAYAGDTGTLIDCQNGIVLCSQNVAAGVVSVPAAGILWKSTNYGQNWSLKSFRNDFATTINALIYLGNGYILAGAGPTAYTFLSTDYGENFTRTQRLGTETGIQSLCSLGFGRVLAGAASSGSVYKSDDYGSTWALVTTLANASIVYAIESVGYEIVLAATGPSGKLYRSMDNGETWSLILTAASQQIRAFIVLSSGTTLAATAIPGLIYSSLNCAAETYPIHNLGFLPSQAVEPSAYSQLSPSKFDPFPINLKYQSSDYIRINLVQGGVFDIFCAQVVESLDLSQRALAWRMVIIETPWLANTAAGALPSTIERVASYTPLVTANFNNNFNASINNLQAMADFLDDFDMSGSGGSGTAVYTDRANTFTNATPLILPATCWIGPSAATGISFSANEISLFLGSSSPSVLWIHGGTNLNFLIGGDPPYVFFNAVDDANENLVPILIVGSEVNFATGEITNLFLGTDAYSQPYAAITGFTLFRALDSISVATDIFQINPYFIDPTHGSFTTRTVFNAYRAAGSVECMRFEGIAAARIGFFGHAAAVQPDAFTQTYSTASHTQNNLTSATLTDNSGGSSNTTLESIGSTYSQSAVRNNFADLAAMVNKDTADIVNLKQVLNAVIDDLQSMGLFA